MKIYSSLIPGLLLPFCFVVNLYGQTITGRIVSEFSEPLAGASICIPHTNIGTVTDSNGNYSITIDSIYHILRYSHIGFEDKYHTIENDTIVNITLKRSPVELKAITIYGPLIKIKKRGYVQSRILKKMDGLKSRIQFM